MANCKYKDDKERKQAKNRQNQAWYRRKRAKLLERAATSSLNGDRSSEGREGSRSVTPGEEDSISPEEREELLSALETRLDIIRRRCASHGYDEPVHVFLAHFEASYSAIRCKVTLTQWLTHYEDMLRQGNYILDDVQGVVKDWAGSDTSARFLREKWAELMDVSMKVHWLMAVLQVRLDLIQRNAEGVEVDWGSCMPSGTALR